MLYAWKDGCKSMAEGSVLQGEVNPEKCPGKPDYYTEYMYFTMDCRRIKGQYKYHSAEAELGLTQDNKPKYLLQMKFVDVADAKELYLLIRAGKIWPAVSFEEQQVPSPLRHVKDLWREVWGIVRREVAARYYQLNKA